jgi:hypothetical protein
VTLRPIGFPPAAGKLQGSDECIVWAFFFCGEKMWGDNKKQDDTKPPEGKTPEQSKAEADDLITRMSATFAETIKPLQDKVNSYEQRFESIENATRRPAPKAEDRQVASVLDDEDKAFADRLLPVNAGLILMNARITESEVYNEMESKGWGAYISKAKEALANVNLQTKGSPEYPSIVRNTVKMIVGDEAMNKGLRFDAGKQTFFMEDSNGKVDTSSTNAKYSKLMELANDGRIPVVKGSSVEDVIEFLHKKMGIKDVDSFLKTVAS